VKLLLKGTSQALFLITGLLFLVGGRAISELTKTDGVLAVALAILRPPGTADDILLMSNGTRNS
jgi:hypothetical protein